MTNRIYFFSRDERTHLLFRSSWHLAAERNRFEVTVVCRGFGLRRLCFSILCFIRGAGVPRVIFGSSEICLYSIFSAQRDVWVFTGLGRLFTGGGIRARAVGRFLRFFYRGQKLVVLNAEDRVALIEAVGGNPFVIEGEGYKFGEAPQEASVISRNVKFAYVGRLLKSKGVYELLRSFSLYSRIDWSLLVIGDCDFGNRDSLLQEDLLRFAHSSRGRIIFTGFRSDVISLLKSVDVLISLSAREGLPFSILDGIEAGLQLVLSPVPGHLSFKGLDGVTFVEPRELPVFFVSLSNDALSLNAFDRNIRLAACVARFGLEAVTTAIENLLFKPNDVAVTLQPFVRSKERDD